MPSVNVLDVADEAVGPLLVDDPGEERAKETNQEEEGQG